MTPLSEGVLILRPPQLISSLPLVIINECPLMEAMTEAMTDFQNKTNKLEVRTYLKLGLLYLSDMNGCMTVLTGK